jgi:adenylosuccinate lyase
MISRYTRQEAAVIFSDRERFRLWLRIELCVLDAMADLGLAPNEVRVSLKERLGDGAQLQPARILEIEEKTRHDVIAFLTHVEELAGPDTRWLHLGLTSSDVLDTALALQLLQASNLLLAGLDRLFAALEKRSSEHKYTPMIGRSHGIHAEPTTAGLALALFADELHSAKMRLLAAKEELRVGKLSGAVGTYANLPPEVESAALATLGLRPPNIATQVLSRDRYAAFGQAMALVAAVIESISLKVRHWQSTEINEAEEFFHPGQKGSSAMPHKRNPVLSENLTGLSRLVRSHANVLLENIPLWHERDISHSSVERVALVDAILALDFMLHRAAGMVEKLVFYPERMMHNLELTRGLIYSQQILLALAKKGLRRQEAYVLVQRNAMKTFSGAGSFLDNLCADDELLQKLSHDEIKECFSLHKHLKHVDVIFQRVFGTPTHPLSNPPSLSERVI